MNNSRSSELESHKSLQILNELSDNDSLTQRDLSSRLDIALGLVNSYIKNLIAKGFITVKSIHPRRYAYFLTPKGLPKKPVLPITCSRTIPGFTVRQGAASRTFSRNSGTTD
jgi:Mn-dependent DtxR family transcriptional regulator